MKQSYLYGLLAIAIAILICTLPGKKEVTLSAKNWICSGSDTFGIEARCTEYTYIPNKGEIQK